MKITLYSNGRATFESKVFTICNEPLEIEVKAEYDNLYAVCNLGKERCVIKVKDGILSIPPSFLTPGILLLNLQQVEDGKPIKTWNAEKVILRDLDDKYEVIPEIVLLRNEISTLKKAMKELYGLVNKNNLI